jgi:DNA polymerase-3 subunit gamma/tau
MSRIGTRIATIAAAGGGLVAAVIALSPIAAADPAPAAPGAPGIDLMSQLGNAPAMASQFLQSAASMLSPKPAQAQATATPGFTPPALPGFAPTTTGLSPAASAPASTGTPTATASLSLPENPAAPLTNPMNSMVGQVPTGSLNVPSTNPISPLLNQLGLPSNLTNLPLTQLGANPGAPIPPPVLPGQSTVAPDLNPFSALP